MSEGKSMPAIGKDLLRRFLPIIQGLVDRGDLNPLASIALTISAILFYGNHFRTGPMNAIKERQAPLPGSQI